jgi:hypothetical protein
VLVMRSVGNRRVGLCGEPVLQRGGWKLFECRSVHGEWGSGGSRVSELVPLANDHPEPADAIGGIGGRHNEPDHDGDKLL